MKIETNNATISIDDVEFSLINLEWINENKKECSYLAYSPLINRTSPKKILKCEYIAHSSTVIPKLRSKPMIKVKNENLGFDFFGEITSSHYQTLPSGEILVKNTVEICEICETFDLTSKPEEGIINIDNVWESQFLGIF